MQQDTLNRILNYKDTLLWQESYISVDSVLGSARKELLTPLNIASEMVILLLIFFLFIFYYGRILEGALLSFKAIFREKKIVAMEGSALLYTARNSVLVFSIFTISFVLISYYRSELTLIDSSYIGLNYIGLNAIIFLYLAYRYIIARVVSLITKNNIFVQLYKYFLTYFVTILLLIPIWLLLGIFVPKYADLWVYSGFIGIVLIIYLLHLYRAYRVIIKEEFSYIFYILYLCTLEFLPLVSLVCFISN